MLKRNIAILIAGGLLSVQVGSAAAEESTFPMGADDLYSKPLPDQLKYLEQRAADIQKEPQPEGAISPSGNRYSSSGLNLTGVAGNGIITQGRLIAQQPPELTKYLYQTLPAELAKDGMVLRGDSFPPSADDLYSKMLPAQARYFEQRTATLKAGR